MENARRLRGSRTLVKLLEWLVIVSMGLLVLDVLWGVISRGLGEFKAWAEPSLGDRVGFLPDGQSSWTEELARFLLIWAAMLGGALAFERRAHLGVDYFVGKFHRSARRLLGAVAHVLVLIFAVLVLIQGGWLLIETTVDSGQVTPALGLKKWVVYSVVPLAGGFVVLFSMQNLWTTLKERERGEAE